MCHRLCIRSLCREELTRSLRLEIEVERALVLKIPRTFILSRLPSTHCPCFWQITKRVCMKRTRKLLLHQRKSWTSNLRRQQLLLDVHKTPVPKRHSRSTSVTDNSIATFNSLQKPLYENSTKRLHRNYLSFATAPSPKAAKSPAKNPNNPKHSENGALKSSNQ